MDPLYILVVLGAGFLFTSNYPIAKFKQLRSSGWILYFHTFLWGVIFSGLSLIVMQLLDNLRWFRRLHNHIVLGKMRVEDLTWVILTLALAFLVGWCSSKITSIKEKSIQKCVSESPVKAKLYQAVLNAEIIMVTLDTGKVYSGLILDAIDMEKPEMDYLALCPYKSGYRDQKTQVIRFTNNYWSYFKSIYHHYQSEPNSFTKISNEIRKYSIVLPLKHIVSIENYDPVTFEHVNNKL